MKIWTKQVPGHLRANMLIMIMKISDVGKGSRRGGVGGGDGGRGREGAHNPQSLTFDLGLFFL